MKPETATFTVRTAGGERKVEMTGDADAIREVVSMVVRGSCEMYIDSEKAKGREREEIVEAIVRRFRIAGQHHKLGETDGLHCDLTDM